MSRVDSTRRSIRRHLVGGIAVVAFLVAGVGGWASTTELSGAVIAAGMLVVDTSVKKVQHPTGGVVGELRVRDGDRVKQGDVLLRLDETVTRANLAIVTKNLDELAARQARDEAERDGENRITFPADLLERAKTSPEVARLIAGETKLFETRAAPGRASARSFASEFSSSASRSRASSSRRRRSRPRSR
jgi:HlyD family secretion protein